MLTVRVFASTSGSGGNLLCHRTIPQHREPGDERGEQGDHPEGGCRPAAHRDPGAAQPFRQPRPRRIRLETQPVRDGRAVAVLGLAAVVVAVVGCGVTLRGVAVLGVAVLGVAVARHRPQPVELIANAVASLGACHARKLTCTGVGSDRPNWGFDLPCGRIAFCGEPPLPGTTTTPTGPRPTCTAGVGPTSATINSRTDSGLHSAGRRLRTICGTVKRHPHCVRRWDGPGERGQLYHRAVPWESRPGATLAQHADTCCCGPIRAQLTNCWSELSAYARTSRLYSSSRLLRSPCSRTH